jgi:hypothetical protein
MYVRNCVVSEELKDRNLLYQSTDHSLRSDDLGIKANILGPINSTGISPSGNSIQCLSAYDIKASSGKRMLTNLDFADNQNEIIFR